MITTRWHQSAKQGPAAACRLNSPAKLQALNYPLLPVAKLVAYNNNQSL
jgi:hypothetical protein